MRQAISRNLLRLLLFCLLLLSGSAAAASVAAAADLKFALSEIAANFDRYTHRYGTYDASEGVNR